LTRAGPAGENQPALLDVAPTIRAIVEDLRRGTSIPRIAGRFHRTITELLAQVCLRAREQSGLAVVALSGGVFQNRLLLEQLLARLEELDFQVLLNRRVPPNDGGLSLGQAAIAAAKLQIAHRK
jgi:hydrogenase maturation protein HypF